MALPATIETNIRNGGIRQGKVFFIDSAEDLTSATLMGLGVQQGASLDITPVESEKDSNGRTWTIALEVSAQVVLMQHGAAEIEAVAMLSSETRDMLLTDNPYSEAEVLALINAGTVPGTILAGVFPKVTYAIKTGTEDSMITIDVNGTLKPDALDGYAAEPILRFPS